MLKVSWFVCMGVVVNIVYKICVMLRIWLVMVDVDFFKENIWKGIKIWIIIVNVVKFCWKLLKVVIKENVFWFFVKKSFESDILLYLF